MPRSIFNTLILTLSLSATTALASIGSNGLAPEVTDLNAEDVSYALEFKLPYLEEAYINAQPQQKKDGIIAGELGVDGGDKATVMDFVRNIAEGRFGNRTDSLLIYSDNKLLLESYFRRGRANYPHYQMSITKAYTSLAVGRAVQMGYLTMADLDKSVISFLKDIDASKLAPGASDITLHEVLSMRSGIRVEAGAAKKLRKSPDALKGQKQAEAYLSITAPVTEDSKAFKYQAADPSLAMQVLESAVPGGAKAFIENELLGKMGITNYAWQTDTSGFPKAAAGSSFRSRDMVKIGMLVQQDGYWDGQPLIDKDFLARSVSSVTQRQQNLGYGYFWWSHNVYVEGEPHKVITGRGAGGQFIFIFPEQDLVIAATAHNKGMGSMLKRIPEAILPAFL